MGRAGSETGAPFPRLMIGPAPRRWIADEEFWTSATHRIYPAGVIARADIEHYGAAIARGVRKLFLPLLLVSLAIDSPAASVQEVGRLIEQGRWQEARREIELGLAQPGLDFRARE